MKLLLALFVVALIGFWTPAHGQNRTFGANKILIDNGSGGFLTIIYNGPGGDTLYLNGDGLGSGDLPSGTSGQTLRHDGSSFVATSSLLNTGEMVVTGGGVRHNTRTINGNDSLLATDHIVFVSMGDSCQIDVRMPLPAAGRIVVIRGIDFCEECQFDFNCLREIRILPNSGEEIEEDTEYFIDSFARSVTLVSDGTDWYVVANTFGGF